MGRAILAGVVGYLVMAIAVMAIFTAAFVALGVDRVFQPGTYEISTLWLGVWGVGTVLAGLIGGFVCAKIARAGSRAWIGLSVAMVLLGVLSAVMAGTRPDPGPRGPDVRVVDAAQKAKQPAWTAWAQIPMGIAGVALGARLGGRRSGAAPKSA